MYLLFFKLHSWGKRFGSSRRRFIQRFPNFMQGGSIMKKLISICLAALIILINLPIGALAAEAKPSEYDEFISLACDVFPEFSNKIRANNSSYSRNATSSQRKHVYTETRNVSENEY